MQGARLLTRAGHHDPTTEQRPAFEPGEIERRDRSDHDRRRRFDRFGADRREGAADRALLRMRTPPHHGDRRVRCAATVDEALRNRRDAAGSHEHDEGAAGARERVPVGAGRVLGRVLVAGDDRDVGGESPVGDGYPRVRGSGDRARDAGHHFERHARGDEGLGLFTAAAEDERIASLQSHHRCARLPALDEQAVDVGLFHRDATRSLAHVDALGRDRCEVEQVR